MLPTLSAVKEKLFEMLPRWPTSLHHDVLYLFLQRAVRMFAFGSSTLVLSLYLSALGNSDEAIGLFMMLTLAGDVAISASTSIVADAIGRRRILVLGSFLMALSGVAFFSFDNFWVLLFASIFGVISPSGGDVGPFKAVEESTLAQLLSANDMHSVLAYYYMLGSWGAALGTISAGWLVQTMKNQGQQNLEAYRAVFLLYSVLGFIKICLSLKLSIKCEKSAMLVQRNDSQSEEGNFLLELESENVLEFESDQNDETRLFSFSPSAKRIMLRLCPLLVLDSLGTGLTNDSWLAYFMDHKFKPKSTTLGTIFSLMNFIESFSNIMAIPVVRWIGLINTIFCGHALSSTALFFFPFPQQLGGLIVLVIIRSIFFDFDQATRQTFVICSVLPQERTVVMGAINMTRTLAQSLGPTVTGFLSSYGKLNFAFMCAGGLKWTYEILLLVTFGGTKL
ncbi:unnamed protein product [Penicillium manginii]